MKPFLSQYLLKALHDALFKITKKAKPGSQLLIIIAEPNSAMPNGEYIITSTAIEDIPTIINLLHRTEAHLQEAYLNKTSKGTIQ